MIKTDDIRDCLLINDDCFKVLKIASNTNVQVEFVISTHTVFDSHLNLCSVQAYDTPLLGNPISGFPSFVCFVVITSKLYHFLTQSQDFFSIFFNFQLAHACEKRVVKNGF